MRIKVHYHSYIHYPIFEDDIKVHSIDTYHIPCGISDIHPHRVLQVLSDLFDKYESIDNITFENVDNKN